MYAEISIPILFFIRNGLIYDRNKSEEYGGNFVSKERNNRNFKLIINRDREGETFIFSSERSVNFIGNIFEVHDIDLGQTVKKLLEGYVSKVAVFFDHKVNV